MAAGNPSTVRDEFPATRSIALVQSPVALEHPPPTRPRQHDKRLAAVAIEKRRGILVKPSLRRGEALAWVPTAIRRPSTTTGKIGYRTWEERMAKSALPVPTNTGTEVVARLAEYQAKAKGAGSENTEPAPRADTSVC